MLFVEGVRGKIKSPHNGQFAYNCHFRFYAAMQNLNGRLFIGIIKFFWEVSEFFEAREVLFYLWESIFAKAAFLLDW